MLKPISQKCWNITCTIGPLEIRTRYNERQMFNNRKALTHFIVIIFNGFSIQILSSPLVQEADICIPLKKKIDKSFIKK